MALQSLGEIMAGMLLSHEAEQDDGDYREDGLLYCGKCGTSKECRTEIMGKVFTVPCMCRCAEEAYDRKQQDFREEQRRLRIQRMKVEGIQDDSLRNVTFDDADDSENMRKCKAFVERWDAIYRQKIGLLMTGPVGTGKTFAAACIANALIERGVPVLMTSFPVILGTSKYELNDTIRQAQEYDLIIVDDLGAERDTDYALEIVFQFVDARYRSGKPLIVTTNLTPQEMRKQTGLAFSRIYDRIMEMCLPMVFTGDSRRAERRTAKRGILREIMNGGQDDG